MANACCKKNDCGHELWDIERDQMREFCNVRQEIKETGWAQQRENDRYFYENRSATDKGFYDQRTAIDRNDYNTLMGFKNNEILGLQSKSEILARIDTLERTFKEDEIRKQSNEISHLRTLLGIRGLGAVPAFAACPPIDCNNSGYGMGW